MLYRRDLKEENTGNEGYPKYCYEHISSPNVQVRTDLEVEIDFEPGGDKEVDCELGDSCYVMYFHCPWLANDGDQVTFAAISEDGKKFYHYSDSHLGNPYASLAQIFPFDDPHPLNGRWLHVSRRGNNETAPLTITNDATAMNDALPDDVWTEIGCNDPVPMCSGNAANHLQSPIGVNNSQIHHVGITARGRYLYVFFHRKGYDQDKPMHLRVGRIDLFAPISNWDHLQGVDEGLCLGTRESFPVMAPVTYYERLNPSECSQVGEGGPPPGDGGCDVRDPNIFDDSDGRTYF